MGVGAFFEVLYIPPGPEAPSARTSTWPLSSRRPPTPGYKYICEIAEPDGTFYYPQEGLTIPGPGERMFEGLHVGQCPCCYYRTREILEWTKSGPGCLALMTPGWYQDEDGSWKWWHADPPHGNPGWSCRDWEEEEENLETLADADESLIEWENLESLDPIMEALADADENLVEAQQDPESSEPPQDQVNLDQSGSTWTCGTIQGLYAPGWYQDQVNLESDQNENQNSHENRDSGPEESSH